MPIGLLISRTDGTWFVLQIVPKGTIKIRVWIGGSRWSIVIVIVALMFRKGMSSVGNSRGRGYWWSWFRSEVGIDSNRLSLGFCWTWSWHVDN